MGLFAGEGMGVWFRDDPDAGPAGVTQDLGLGGVGRERVVEQLVMSDRGAKPAGVVAEVADLRRGLVDEHHRVTERPHRAGAEQWIGSAGVDPVTDGGIGEVEPMAADEEVQTGGVASADLEAIDGRQGKLDRGEGLQRRSGGPGAGEVVDGPGRSDAVVTDRPGRVPYRDQCRVQRLELMARRGLLPGVEFLLDRGQEQGDRLAPSIELAGAGRVAHERKDPGRAPQVDVDAPQLGCDVVEGLESSGPVGQLRPRLVERRDQLSQVRRLARRRTANHADDSAHRPSSLRGLWRSTAGTLNRLNETVGDQLGLVEAGCLDHDPHHGLGAGRSDQDSPVGS